MRAMGLVGPVRPVAPVAPVALVAPVAPVRPHPPVRSSKEREAASASCRRRACLSADRLAGGARGVRAE
eukprot:gene14388-biopygen2069